MVMDGLGAGCFGLCCMGIDIIEAVRVLEKMVSGEERVVGAECNLHQEAESRPFCLLIQYR